MTKNTMDYLAWSRVIDGLETDIASSENMIAISTKFLETAKKERAKYPEPEPKEDDKNTITG